MKISPETRQELYKDLKILHYLETKMVMPDKERNEKRNRTGAMYLDHLRGLRGTLDHVAGLPVNTIVDLGAGSSRAVGQIAHSAYGEGLRFLATGIVRDPEIDKHIGRSNYRFTPAEIMRGFDPSSVGGFISVYGPFEYSKHLELVLERADELLIPRGIIKFCIMKYVPDNEDRISTDLLLKRQERCDKIEKFFRENGYGLAMVDWNIIDRIGTNRTFLGIRPGDREDDLDSLAQSIMEKDLMNLDAMKFHLNNSTE